MSTKAAGVKAISSGWSSGSLVFYESAYGRTTTGDLLTIGTTQITFGNTAQDVDVKIWLGSTQYVLFDAGAHTVTFSGLDVTITGDLTIDTEDIALGDNDSLEFGDAADVTMTWDGTNLAILPATDNTGEIQFGNDGTKSMDVRFYGATASYSVLWDMNGDTNGSWLFGADTKGIMTYWYGDTASYSVHWDPSGDTNGCWYFGADDYGVDVIFYGKTASAALTWDSSTDDLIWTGLARAILGNSGTPLALTAGSPILSVYSTCAGTDGGTNAEPVVFNSVMTGAGQVGGRVKVNMDTNVVLGGWANAFKAQVDCKTNGGSSGLLSAACIEMIFPASAGSGHYQILEIEANCPASWAGTASNLPAFIGCNLNGATKGNFDDVGALFDIEGVTSGSGDLWYANKSVPFDAYLKIYVNGTAYYLGVLAQQAAAT